MLSTTIWVQGGGKHLFQYVIYWGFYKNRSVTPWVQIRKLNLSSAWFLQNSFFALQPAFSWGFILFFQSIKPESSAYLLRSKVKFHTLFPNRILQKAPWWQLLIKAAVLCPITWHWDEECANHLKVLSGSYPKRWSNTWKWWIHKNRKWRKWLVSY